MNKKGLQHQNLDVVISQIKFDMIHVQWVSVLPWLEAILETQKNPVVLSQGGYHSSVRPFVNYENMEYLTTWYSKVVGFHSVSKAISKKGDLINVNISKIDHVGYTGVNLNVLKFHKSYKNGFELTMFSIW